MRACNLNAWDHKNGRGWDGVAPEALPRLRSNGWFREPSHQFNKTKANGNDGECVPFFFERWPAKENELQMRMQNLYTRPLIRGGKWSKRVTNKGYMNMKTRNLRVQQSCS